MCLGGRHGERGWRSARGLLDDARPLGRHGHSGALGAAQKRLARAIGELHLLELRGGGRAGEASKADGQMNVFARGAVLVGKRRDAERLRVAAQKFAFVQQQIAFVA